MIKKHYVINKAEKSPVLNSGWNGPYWQEANVLKIEVVRKESSSHHPQTELKLLYHDNAIFGLFRVKDKYVRAIRSGFQVSVCRDSCVEFFFKPKPESGYFNFEFNCSGAMLCFYIVDNSRIPEKERAKIPEPNEFRNYTPLKTEDLKKVKIFHSMPAKVDPEIQEDNEWFVSFEIPLKMLEKYTGKLGDLTGQIWEANCYKCADETSHPHWISWNPIKEKNFHCPECFGVMEFK